MNRKESVGKLDTKEQDKKEQSTKEQLTKDYLFHYSAKEHNSIVEEITRIQCQYLPTNKVEFGTKLSKDLDDLRALDKKAKKPALLTALSLAICGVFTLGFGMSLALAMDHLILGSLIGISGILVLSSIFPIHQRLLAIGKEKYSLEIQNLCRELLEANKSL